MRHIHRVLIVSRSTLIAATLAVGASRCTDARPTAPNLRTRAVSPAALISDAAHSAGNPHFYFLPPLVFPPKFLLTPNPTFPAPFDAGLSPVVEICVLQGTACGRTIATYSTTSGPTAERVKVIGGELSSKYDLIKHYSLKWPTRSFQLDPAATYRIRVSVAGIELGFADVDVVSSLRELRSVNTGEFIPLVNGTLLPITFRIETGAISARTVGPEGGTVVSPGDQVSLQIPAGALSTPVYIGIARTAAPNTDDFFGAYDFGPGGTTFTSPAILSFAVDPASHAALGPGATPVVVTQAQPNDTTWTFVSGSRYDAATGVLSAPVTHFSKYAIIDVYYTDIVCARIAFNLPATSFNCRIPTVEQYRDTIQVSEGGSIPTGLVAGVAKLHGPLWVIGTIASCEDIPVDSDFCLPGFTTASADPSIAVRNNVGSVFGFRPGNTVLYPLYYGLSTGSTLVQVTRAHWDVSADFSETLNPNGPWSYGWESDLGLPFHLYTLHERQDGGVLAAWRDPHFQLFGTITPTLQKNISAGTTIYSIRPGEISLHSGCSNGELSVLRWTAPSAGTYAVHAQFLAGNIGNTDASVLLDGNSSQPLLAAPTTNVEPSYSGTLALSGGQTLDFIVGAGGDGCFFDSTPVVVSVRLQ